MLVQQGKQGSAVGGGVFPPMQQHRRDAHDSIRPLCCSGGSCLNCKILTRSWCLEWTYWPPLPPSLGEPGKFCFGRRSLGSTSSNAHLITSGRGGKVKHVTGVRHRDPRIPRATLDINLHSATCSCLSSSGRLKSFPEP